MKIIQITGIYQIMNIINNKKYIGQSVNIFSRWAYHIDSLNKGTHHNKRQRSWIKYGSENFRFSILIVCDKKELTELEHHYIKKFGTYNHDTDKKYIEKQSLYLNTPLDCLWYNGISCQQLINENILECHYNKIYNDVLYDKIKYKRNTFRENI